MHFEVCEQPSSQGNKQKLFISTIVFSELAWVYKWTANRVENLQTALRCLDTIRELARHQSQTAAVRDLIQDVTKKTSAICNELGKAYMSQAECLMTSGKLCLCMYAVKCVLCRGSKDNTGFITHLA